MHFPDYIDDEDVRLWMKELILAGRETSCTWRPGKRHTVESVDDNPEALDCDAVIEVWAEDWYSKNNSPDCGEYEYWDAKYRYETREGKTGWWRFKE